MNLSLIKIRSIFPHFNQQRITAEDFWRAAKASQLIVRQMPLAVDGYYTICRDKHLILLNSRLKSVAWLRAALHEFHHFMFDVPGVDNGFTFYRRGQFSDRREYRADAFAVIGIMPWPEIEQLRSSDLIVSPWLSEIIKNRLDIKRDFGI